MATATPTTPATITKPPSTYGHFADPAKREERHDKDLSILARSGFSYDMAQRVIDAENADELEELLNPPAFDTA